MPWNRLGVPARNCPRLANVYNPRLLTLVILFDSACSTSPPVFSRCLPRVSVMSSLHVQYWMLLVEGSVLSLPRRDSPPTSIVPINGASLKNGSGCASELPGVCSQMRTLVEKRAAFRKLGVNVLSSSTVKNWFFECAFEKNCGNPVVPITPVVSGYTCFAPS